MAFDLQEAVGDGRKRVGGFDIQAAVATQPEPDTEDIGFDPFAGAFLPRAEAMERFTEAGTGFTVPEQQFELPPTELIRLNDESLNKINSFFGGSPGTPITPEMQTVINFGLSGVEMLVNTPQFVMELANIAGKFPADSEGALSDLHNLGKGIVDQTAKTIAASTVKGESAQANEFVEEVIKENILNPIAPIMPGLAAFGIGKVGAAGLRKAGKRITGELGEAGRAIGEGFAEGAAEAVPRARKALPTVEEPVDFAAFEELLEPPKRLKKPAKPLVEREVKVEPAPEFPVEEFGQVEAVGDRFRVVGEVAGPEQVAAKGEIPLFKSRGQAEKYIETVHEQVRRQAEVVGDAGKFERLNKLENDALDRIKKRGTRLSAGIDPIELFDYAIVGATKIARGAIKFAEWSKEMIFEFGDNIKPHLVNIYNDAQKYLKSEKGAIRIPSFEEIRRPAGAKPVPFEEAIKAPDRPEMKNMETYYQTISAPEGIVRPVKLTPKAARLDFKEFLQSRDIPSTLTEYRKSKGVTSGLKDEYAGITRQARKDYQLSKQEAVAAEAQEAGIALKTTPSGKVLPAVRKAGTFVTEEAAQYGAEFNRAVEALEGRLADQTIGKRQFKTDLKQIKSRYPYHFKDAKQGIMGGTKDFIRYVQEIDGALSPQQKAKLPNQVGPAEQQILRRTEDIMKIELDWSATQELKIQDVIKDLTKEQEIKVTEVLEQTAGGDNYVPTENFLRNRRIRAITDDPVVVQAAQRSRELLESWFDQQNAMRGMRGQEPIDYRQYYAPHVLREATVWEKVSGSKIKPKDIKDSPQLPDYIKPNAPFNPRAMAREFDMSKQLREMRIGKLLQNYANTASRDIHHTSIIQNNKAFIQQLETMGFKHAAEGLSNFTAEGYGGVPSRLDRALDFPLGVRKGMRYWRGALMRSVFPLNWAWNTTVQTLSSGMTVMRTGVTNSTRGMFDWYTNPALRNDIKGAYSYRIKAQKAGRITRQDINTGVTQSITGKRSTWEAANDGANYLTELIEREMTGWSIGSALRHGAKRGLKGKALWNYASDTGAKTQSMYNLENKPGVLRSEAVQTGAPFQTFVFEMYNTAKEVAGKTGTPPGAMTERMGWAMRFTAAAYAGNYIAHAVTGRDPWDIYSFIPFSDQTIKPVVEAIRGKDIGRAAGRALPSPVGAGIEFARSMRQYLATGNSRNLRNWGIKYMTAFAKIPGGTQISRMVDGWIAVADGGVKDSKGRIKFRITDPWEQVRAVALGPYRTAAGIERREKFDTNILEDLGIDFDIDATDILQDLGIVGKPEEKKRGFDLKRAVGE